MTTLREILDYGELGHTREEFRALVESWAYGQEVECYGCKGRGWTMNYESHPSGMTASNPRCDVCNGTGTIRELGLVERVIERVNGKPAYPVAAALREELGVEP